ncbi:MAG: hypothetical protein NXI20_18720 [bacterium]|nr:hypothetical protein [bacterium]
MKRFTLLISIFLISGTISAQKLESVSIGYFGEILIQPGLKTGLNFNLKSLDDERNKWISGSTQIAFYSFPYDHTSLMANFESGYNWKKPDRKLGHYVGIGFGYAEQSKIESLTVNLGTGETENNRIWRTRWIPTVNYMARRDINESFGLFGKLSYGVVLSGIAESRAILFTELGVNLFINSK